MPLFRSRPPPDAQRAPLATQRSAAAWFGRIPAVDAIGRQQIVTRAIDDACRPGAACDIDQVDAIEFLDAELAADRGRLLTQYAEHAEGPSALADRIWEAAFEICRAFIVGYGRLLEHALGAAGDRRWRAVIPRLIARLIHFYGTDAKLRVLKNETWIPAKWVELHGLYRRAADLGIDRAPLGSDAPGSDAARPTIEQEYLAVLLTHLLSTGALVAREVDWAAAQVRLWAAELALDTSPRTPGGFVVDIGGRRGLVRRSPQEAGTLLRYLDTGPLAAQLDRALATLRRQVAADPGGAGPTGRQRIAVLERLGPMVSPQAPPAQARETRVAVRVSMRACLGLTQICRALAPHDAEVSALEIDAGSPAPARAADAPRFVGRSSAAQGGTASRDARWQVEDRSGTGLRIVAPAGREHHALPGTLVALSESGGGDWVLGVVRRVARDGAGQVEAGVSVIATRVSAVALHARRHAREDMGFVVDGVDVSTVGERFDGLYLPPPSRPDRPLTARTLVVPSSEYGEGRKVVIITPRTVYTVALRETLERHADWTWTVIDIVERTARGE